MSFLFDNTQLLFDAIILKLTLHSNCQILYIHHSKKIYDSKNLENKEKSETNTFEWGLHRTLCSDVNQLLWVGWCHMVAVCSAFLLLQAGPTPLRLHAGHMASVRTVTKWFHMHSAWLRDECAVPHYLLIRSWKSPEVAQCGFGGSGPGRSQSLISNKLTNQRKKKKSVSKMQTLRAS